MRCAVCTGELPAGFPGGDVTCTFCGSVATLPTRSAPPAASGPYRGGSAAPAREPDDVPCPFCGNLVLALARECPHCQVRLESVRCGRCWTLQQPGSFTCWRCGRGLELEPLLDATNAPCPRCNTPLDAAQGGAVDDVRVHECARCGGAFVPREVLAEMLTRAELEGPFREPDKRAVTPLDEVRYISCPLCRSSMNRLNFGRVSGVIVDVCKPHGTWFDGGELTRVLAFAAAGGLAKTRAREEAEKKTQKKEQARVHAELAQLRGSNDANERLDEWRSLLQDLFFW
ncbi:MAG: zf-TFIIB domain-containing protein [Labilithrix sp.]|nr:zf-TFIIB domain-containing protein [Labilithrix sp.]MCW5814407.1 zf-TFIIB domain-containing protein [Labilithrix sp.]